MRKGWLSARAVPGTLFDVRARPGARRTEVREAGDGLEVAVTAAAEDGKANAAILRAIALALGVAPSRLQLLRGAGARTKQVRLD